MKTRALLMLGLFATVIPELFTGSTPLPVLLNPGTFLFLALGYGVPVIAIRELAIRKGIGTAGLICFGFAYGIFNEGLFARTLIARDHVPIQQYAHYGVFYGFDVPWCGHILLWHSIASVLLPIVIVHSKFPDVRDRPYLNPLPAVVMGAFILWFGVMAFTHKGTAGGPGSSLQLKVMLTAMALQMGTGLLLKGRLPEPSQPAPNGAVWTGVLCGIATLLLSILAGHRVPLGVYLFILAAIVAVVGAVLIRRNWNTLEGICAFGAGFYIQTIIIGVIALFATGPLAAFTAAADIALMVWIWRTVRPSLPREASTA